MQLICTAINKDTSVVNFYDFSAGSMVKLLDVIEYGQAVGDVNKRLFPNFNDSECMCVCAR